MKRHTNFEKRNDFASQHEQIGFDYWNSPSGPEKLPYWQEGVVYGFSEKEVDKIQEATQELHDMCVVMVSDMIKKGDYPAYFNLDDESIPLIEQSWKRGDKSLYGRFDLAYGENNQLKMFEYNGDTPVSVLECSVAQWNYIEKMKNLPNGQAFPDQLRVQYNLIDETLIETWQKMFAQNTKIHFASGAGFRHEDFGNLCYLMDTALRAGMNPVEIQMQNIGLYERTIRQSQFEEIKFVDEQNEEIKNIFKLYPWEWMTHEKFGKDIQYTNTKWLEPAWKMLLSNKAMLVKLWEMFPNHPLLLKSYAEQPSQGSWAKKAIHGREGSNIYKYDAIPFMNKEVLAPGSHVVPEYDHWGYMYQEWFNVKKHDGMTPILGSWIIGDKACGMSIREDANVVTGNNAFFASHIFVPYDQEEQFKELWK